MKKIFIGIAALSILAGCSKSEADLVDDGTSISSNEIMNAYSGAFTRSNVADTGYFFIDIDLNRYDGNSRDRGFPGICGGYYTLQGSTISFEDTCFVGSAVAMLEGTYNYQKNGDSLRFWRTVGGVTDDYRMKRVTR